MDQLQNMSPKSSVVGRGALFIYVTCALCLGALNTQSLVIIKSLHIIIYYNPFFKTTLEDQALLQHLHDMLH
jgi:hypothetical protein